MKLIALWTHHEHILNMFWTRSEHVICSALFAVYPVAVLYTWLQLRKQACESIDYTNPGIQMLQGLFTLNFATSKTVGLATWKRWSRSMRVPRTLPSPDWSGFAENFLHRVNTHMNSHRLCVVLFTTTIRGPPFSLELGGHEFPKVPRQYFCDPPIWWSKILWPPSRATMLKKL